MSQRRSPWSASVSGALAPYRNDVAFGPVTPEEVVERLDVLLGHDDRSSPDPPAACLFQEAFLLDLVALCLHAFESSIAVNRTQKFRPPLGAELTGVVTHESQRLKVKVSRSQTWQAPLEDLALPENRFEKLEIESTPVFLAKESRAESDVEDTFDAVQRSRHLLLPFCVAFDEQVDVAILGRATPRSRTEEDR